MSSIHAAQQRAISHPSAKRNSFEKRYSGVNIQQSQRQFQAEYFIKL
jgi:hypothetical protein